MFTIGPYSVIAAVGATLAALTSQHAGAAEVCSAWAEPARVATQMKLRERHRMRADQAWVLQVARNPQVKFGYDDILMSPEELSEFRARFDRIQSAGQQRQPMIQQALAYAGQHSNQFAGSYLRRTSDYLFDPPAALVLRFTGDVAVHEAALQSLPPADIALEVLPARFSMKQLEERMEILHSRYADLQIDGSISLLGYGPRVEKNIIEVEAESNATDAAARLEAGHDDMVKAIIYPIAEVSNRAPVTGGNGWRLLGRAENRSGNSDGDRTRVAASEREWRQLRAESKLPPPLRSVNFSREIVLTVTATLGCVENQLDDIVIDTKLQSIEAQFSFVGSPRRICLTSYVGYEVFAVAVERAALPPNPITVPLRTVAADFRDPAFCPRGLVVPRR